jgi:type IV fimbrial biogenesis protein FimT
MLRQRAGQAGLTLIELMVTIAIFAMLMLLAVPTFGNWIQNIRLRATADGVLAGLQAAKAEAVGRNTRVRFQLTSTVDAACALTAAASNWVINIDSNDNPNEVVGRCDANPYRDDLPDAGQEPRILQRRGAGESSGNNVVTAATSATVRFNGFGRVAFDAGAPVAPTTINFTAPAAGNCVAAGGDIRCLRIVVSPAGQVRMCDPAFPATDPVGC